jgi:hypothetical protein
MGVTYLLSNGSMVIASITHGSLTRPRPCGLHTSPAFNVGRMPPVTDVTRCVLHVFNVGAP